MLCACYKTAAVSAVRNIHDVVLERPQSPQLPGGFRCSDTARAQTLDPYRERLVLLGVLLFQVACNTVISTQPAVAIRILSVLRSKSFSVFPLWNGGRR